MKIIWTFFIFSSLFLSSSNSFSQGNNDNFKNSYQYQRIKKEIAQTKNDAELQLQTLLNLANNTKKQQYFIHHNLAFLYFTLHHKNKTLLQINNAIELAKNNNLEPYHLSKSLLLRAKTYGILFRNTKTAITDLQQAILISNSSKHTKIENLRFELQTAMAQAYNQLGQLDNAQKFSEQSLKTVTLLNDKNETIYALIIAGRIAFQQDNFDLAYQQFLKALQLSDSSTPKKQIASIELRLAFAYEHQNNYKQALIHAQKAAILYSHLNEERLQIKSLRVLGNIYLSLGQNIDTALVHFINGLSIAKSINSITYIGQMQHLIGRSYLLEQNLNKAQKYINSAQSALKKSKSWFYLALNTIELAKITEQQGNSAQAINLVNQLLIDPNVQNYPSVLNEAKEYLLTLYINQQDYKKAYLLQQKILANKQIIDKKEAQKMIKKFDHDVEIKSLNEHLAQAKDSNDKNQQLLKKTSLTNNILMLFMFIFALIYVVLYRRKKHWYNRYIQRCNNSFLTWIAFENILKKESTKKSGTGLLICKTSKNIKTAELTFKYQKNQLINHCLTTVKQLNLSPISCLNHDVLWLLCDQPLTQIQSLLTHSIRQSNIHSKNVSVDYIWIALDDFPRNISAESIMFIDILANHLFEIFNTIENRLITKVSIQDKAFPILFSSTENESILDKIKQTLHQGFITTEQLLLNANSVDK